MAPSIAAEPTTAQRPAEPARALYCISRAWSEWRGESTESRATERVELGPRATVHHAWTLLLGMTLEALLEKDALSPQACAGLHGALTTALTAQLFDEEPRPALAMLAEAVNATDAWRGAGEPANQLGEALRFETRLELRLDGRAAPCVVLTCHDRGGDVADQDYERTRRVVITLHGLH